MSQKARRKTRPLVLFEAPRDQVESSFTELLRDLWLDEPQILASVLVDHFGETVDYCSAIPPYDAKVAGAHFCVVMGDAERFAAQLQAGRVSTIEICGAERDLVGRSLGEGYLLVVVVRGGQIGQRLLKAIDRAAERLRAEARIVPPAWDPVAPDLEVEVRTAVGWPFAPTAFVEGGHRREIVAVIGRWEEGGGISGGQLVCFRVRVQGGDEWTLAYDEAQRLWLYW